MRRAALKMLLMEELPVALEEQRYEPPFIYQGHDASSLVERRIGKISFLFQSSQPRLHLQRFDAKGYSPIVGAGGSGELARSLLGSGAPWDG